MGKISDQNWTISDYNRTVPDYPEWIETFRSKLSQDLQFQNIIKAFRKNLHLLLHSFRESRKAECVKLFVSGLCTYIS